MTNPKPNSQEFEQGREAARALWNKGLTATQIDDPLTIDFARGALFEFERLQEETPGVIQDVLEGAQISAEQLNVESFHGLIEVVQNADDLGARTVRVAFKKGRAQNRLLIAHDGERVRLEHVLAMTLAFLSTKREDPRAKGRFGIGLKTLGRLGTTLKVHCPPYDFVIENNRVRISKPSRKINKIYDPRSTDTLLDLELHPGFDPGEFRSWFSNLGSDALVFLDTVTSLRLLDLPGKRTLSHHQIRARPTHEIKLPGLKTPCRRTRLKDPKTGHSWVRFEIEKKVPSNIKRRHKAIGKTTPIGIALPERAEDKGKLYAGLPLGITTGLPISLNAQFDPDAARRGIQHEIINEWLFSQIAELVGSAALDCFENDPHMGWKAIPLREEGAVPEDDWISDRIAGLVETAQSRVKRGLKLLIKGERKALRQITYEVETLDGLIDQREVDGLRPKSALLPKNFRDKQGRWRAVLGEIGITNPIEVKESTSLFDWPDHDLKHRDVQWFIRLARAATVAGLGSHIRKQRSVFTAEGRRVVPPLANVAGRFLLKKSVPDSLALRLDLADVIHPAYLSRSPAAVSVRKWLEELTVLLDSAEPESTLRALAAQGEDGETKTLGNQELRLLREAFETVGPEVAGQLGQKAGQAIEIQVQHWQNKKKKSSLARPSDAYLPASIEDRKGGWGKAAGGTPGINWVHGHYRELLRRAGKRKKKSQDKRSLSARAFFRLLGVENSPRLISPPNTETLYNDPASRINRAQAPPCQLESLSDLARHATHLKFDRFSPDLMLVIADLRRERSARVRRDRVRALFSTLLREWDRLYSDHLFARAVYSDYSWRVAGSIPTSWIGRAMDFPWLTNELGKPTAPRGLAVRTPATEAIFGDDRALFARDLTENDASSPFVRALRIETDPQVSELVEQIAQIRETGSNPNSRDVEIRYAAIASACIKQGQGFEERVGDLTKRQLRARFGNQQNRPGLIFTNDQWLPIPRVFLGASIFGNRRAFVSNKTAAARLWQTLGIKQVTVKDCIDVLEEIAGENPTNPDEQALVNTYHSIEEIIDAATERDKKRLASLPLWTRNKWTSKRPVFVSTYPEITESLSNKIPIWDCPITVTVIPRLIEAIRVQVLDTNSFNPFVNKSAFINGVVLEEKFVGAVELLRDWLARHDPRLSEALNIPWEELAAAKVACDSDMKLELRIKSRRPILVPAHAHLSYDPLTFYFRDPEAVGEIDAGGRTISSLFSEGDCDKLALAWVHCWDKSRRGERGNVSLVKDKGREDTLDDLFKQASGAIIPKRGKRRDKGGVTIKVQPDTKTPISVRRLKKLEDFSGISVELLGKGKNQPSPKNGPGRGLSKEVPIGQPIAPPTRPAPSSAPKDYDDKDREQLALEILQVAINGQQTGLSDYRHLRGVGADALDKLRRYFEIKAHYGPMPDEVTLTGNEAERALLEKENFFLAIISGLEEGYETIVKVFVNPLQSLDLKANTSVTLSGIIKRGSAIKISLKTPTENI